MINFKVFGYLQPYDERGRLIWTTISKKIFNHGKISPPAHTRTSDFFLPIETHYAHIHDFWLIMTKLELNYQLYGHPNILPPVNT